MGSKHNQLSSAQTWLSSKHNSLSLEDNQVASTDKRVPAGTN